MVLAEICAPAFIYLCFSLVQITIDTVKAEYNKAFFKFWVMIIFTMLLNNLCMRGLGIVSWIIVFVPFMLMSIITTILLYVFGFDPSTGKLKYYTDSDEAPQSKQEPTVTNIDSPPPFETSSGPSTVSSTPSTVSSTPSTVSSTPKLKSKENENNSLVFDPQPTETTDNIVTQTSKQDKGMDLKQRLHIDNELVNAIVSDNIAEQQQKQGEKKSN
jgi:hypothetical protein